MSFNVYHLIDHHGNDPLGLWLVRDSWDNMVCRVVDVDPATDGAPYYGNPRVYAEFFYARGVWAKNGPLSCPGTRAYRRIEAPLWARETVYVPLQDLFAGRPMPPLATKSESL